MAGDDRRESLRGVESAVLDMLFQTCTDEQWTELLEAPLERAAFEGNEDVARKLIKAGAGMGFALHYAVRARREKIANILLSTDPEAPVNSRDTYGDFPLCLASEAGDEEMVRSLLLNGAELHASDREECTALYIAARDGHEPVAQALLAAGADVTIDYPRPLLHPAAENGHVGILRTLINSGVDVDARDINSEETALHCAASSGKTGAITFLIEAGADLEARDAEGNTPLSHAASVCGHGAVRALLKHGAEVDVPNEAKETSLRTAAANAGRQGSSEVVDLLLRAGADETMSAEDGRTPMDVIGHEAAGQQVFAEDIERVRKLLGKARVDRTWRRRGILLLCRAHPHRVQPRRRPGNSRMAQKVHGGDGPAKAHEDHGTGVVGSESTLSRKGYVDWTAAAAWVVEIKEKEDDIFRAIVGYL